MKKALNALKILSLVCLCVIIVLAVLYFFDIIDAVLWVKYLFLSSCLVILVTVYMSFGKRTEFDECVFCLNRAVKLMRKLNFNKKERLTRLSLLNIKNYLMFAQRYMENLVYEYDIHIFKPHAAELKTLSSAVVKENLSALEKNAGKYIDTLTTIKSTVESESKKQAEKLLAEKQKRKQRKA
ncbi:MAG: hypothetical protein ACOYEC_02180 [Christensenellales bacterium]|jgi:hypothetical protein|nr:hypothetical protein [Clostridiales bacterium]